MTDLLDRHCPLITVRHRAKLLTPWFNFDCHQARKTGSAERRYWITRTEDDKRSWAAELKTRHLLYQHKCDNFWRLEIEACNGNERKLWKTHRCLLGESCSVESSALSADDFASFFEDKVDAVRTSTASMPLYDVPCRPIESTLDEWSAVTTDEVERLMNASLNKTSQLDLAPTWLVKDMRGLLASFLTLLFNRSLSTRCFPSEFKQAIVRQLLKKSGLDADDPKNYRPISTLLFLSKLLERIVQMQLQTYLNNNDLMPTQQSAYLQHHSTETAVTNVYNDLLLAADSGLVSALCLLDLMAAFDTVDHDLLLLRLEWQFGLRGVPLLWFASYLRCRSYRVWHAGCTSRTVWVACSVPQG